MQTKIFKQINSFVKSNQNNLLQSTSNNLLDRTGDKFDDKIDNIVSKDGTLRIGVVGQVKAGKSSFINALLFGGEDILPKASTPMTAALTVIRYSEQLSAKVEFYSQSDWDSIEHRAKEYQKRYNEVEKELKKSSGIFESVTKERVVNETNLRVGDGISSAYEVYMMAKDSGLELSQYIGQTQNISENISSIGELVGKLQNFVGVGGKYTPITRNTILYLNIPTLKGIELIDTPGINDPIVSRGQVTRDFLSNCDSVFMLSYSGQFMGREDSEFLVTTLPSEGISSITLLGSKFDSVLVDEFKRYKGDIKIALRDLYKKLSKQSKDSLDQIIANSPNRPIMKRLKDIEVKFISGIAYSIAKKKKRDLDEMESHTLELLEKRYSIKFSNELLFDLANIDVIRDRDLAKIKEDKENILSSKLDDFISGQKSELIKELDELDEYVVQRLEELSNGSIEELSQRARELEKGFERARDGIEQTFIDFGFDVKEKIYQLIAEIGNAKADYTGISRSQDSRSVYSHTTGMLWWRERHYTTEYYDIANVNEAVDKAVKFIREANEAISHNWDSAIKLSSIEKKLINEAVVCFDLSDTSFNKNKIINPVKNALRAIKIKPYRLKEKRYIDQITKAFSDNRVEGSDINRLESLLNDTLYSIADHIEETLESKIKEITSLLNEKREGFVESIKEDSYQSINQLKDDLKERENSIKRDEVLIEEIRVLRGGV